MEAAYIAIIILLVLLLAVLSYLVVVLSICLKSIVGGIDAVVNRLEIIIEKDEYNER